MFLSFFTIYAFDGRTDIWLMAESALHRCSTVKLKRVSVESMLFNYCKMQITNTY